jgi:hypothetical protein
MRVMEMPQFLQDRIRLLEARMPHRFVSRNTGKGQPAESLGNLYPAGSLINAPGLIDVRLSTVVSAMAGQVISDPHEHTPQTAIRLADDGATIKVCLIALIS